MTVLKVVQQLVQVRNRQPAAREIAALQNNMSPVSMTMTKLARDREINREKERDRVMYEDTTHVCLYKVVDSRCEECVDGLQKIHRAQVQRQRS